MMPKTLFEQFGHYCELFRPTAELRKVRPCFMISEMNRRSYNFLRSLKKIENERKKSVMYPHIIHPFSDFRTYWELFMAIVIFLQFLLLPLDVAMFDLHFDDVFTHHWMFIALRCFTDLMSLVHICINFFTGYCKHKDIVVVMQPEKISRYYIVNGFFFDLYCSIPYDLLLNMYDGVFGRKVMFLLRYSQLLKGYRYKTFLRYCTHYCEATDKPSVHSNCALAVISFLLYVHWIDCCLIALTCYQMPWRAELQNHFVLTNVYGYPNQSFTRCYIIFLYIALMLILNAGTYEIDGETPMYQVFCISIWICSRVLYALCVAYFLCLTTAFLASTQRDLEIVMEVEGYMRHRQVPPFLQKRILAYYEIKYNHSYFKESEITETVSSQLKQEMAVHACKKLLDTVQFLKGIPTVLTVRIIQSLKYEMYLTNDVITKAGTIVDCMYFLTTGTVAVYKRNGKEIYHSEDGSYFGEIGLLFETLRPVTVVACDVCEVYRLDRKDFNRTILPFPELYNTIKKTALDRIEDVMMGDEIYTNVHSSKSPTGSRIPQMFMQ